jgi:hypothetical protein
MLKNETVEVLEGIVILVLAAGLVLAVGLVDGLSSLLISKQNTQ